jgi:Domain of unknown function (DUF2828)
MSKRELVHDVIRCTHYQGNEKLKYRKYRQILSLYYKHKMQMTDIIMHLHKYSSFKAYLYLLSINKDDELENLIFSVLINTLNDDIKKCDNKQEISTLAKWLPRENSSFDKKLNFVNRFVLKLFPNIFANQYRDLLTNLNIAKKQYRLILTKLNSYLGTLEVKLCSQDKKIEYEKLNTTQINKYFYKFLKDDKVPFTCFLKNKYMEMGVNIIDCIYNNNIKHPEEKEICDQIWETVKFKYYNQFKSFEENSDLVVDITQGMYEDKMISKIFALVLMFIENNKCVYMNQNKVIIENKDCAIFEKVNLIKHAISISNKIVVPKDNKNKMLYVITTKDIDQIESFENYDKIYIIKYDFEDENYFKIEKQFATNGISKYLKFF